MRISSLEGLLVNRGEFTLISPVGLVKPFLTLTRGKRPHFVARETVTSPPPNKWKEAAKGGVL